MRRALPSASLALLLLLAPAGLAAPPPAAAGGTATAAAAEPDDPGSLALVLDSSGSMAEPAGGGGGSRIEAARSALTTVVDGLPDDQAVSFRVFGASDVPEGDPAACTDSERIVDRGTDNRDDLRAAIAAYEPVGWTPTGYALQQAADDLGPEGPRTILLVSDGESTCDPDPCVVAAELAADGIDLRIDVVGLDVSGSARDQLACVAEAGGGTYVDADDADSITEGLRDAAVRASRPFDLTGEPVEGTVDVAGAPTVGTGQYLDRFRGAGEQFYLLERAAPGTTFHVGLTLVGEGGSSGSGGGLALAPLREDGTAGVPCDTGSAFDSSIGEQRPVFYASADSGRDPDAECATADRLVLTVREAQANVGQGAAFELAVYEEPPLADPAEATGEPLPDPAWSPLEPGAADDSVVPGTSLSSAPVVGDGSYALDINAGETQVLAVPLDWGQHVQAQLDATLTGPVMEAAAIGSQLRVSFIGPLRDAASADLTGSDAPADWTTGALANLTDPAYRTGALSRTVAYPQRFAFGPEKGSSVAGLRYVAVNLAVRGDEANQPYTLTIRTGGTAGEGTPEYEEVDGLEPPAADSALVSSAVGESQPEDGEASDGSGSSGSSDGSSADAGVSVVGIGAGVAVLVVLAVLVVGGLLLVRRRARR
ncbi:VWA domain-containing protein [Nocardioides sp. ChNu-153]|uniref:VWA domain-containing protein n=1 Tax=unclassified Nocardioides TaxID=2615069 RepID=UPI0024075E9F|nr:MULTISPECIES: VWA domain-containing protein [unclassified Nocardioides]MDF9716700.1 VWA domain-containing protein [Nocardioides sp. ChNu-99]MDN7121150.1 VWA domain-containing protein [Nocardioides sp. ChNu-153]